MNVKTKIESPFRYMVAGVAGTAVIGALVTRFGFSPKLVASAIGIIGAGLAWKSQNPMIRSLGAGAMAAAGSQLAVLVIQA